MDQTGLTLYESAIFQTMLEQMVFAGDGRGQVYIYAGISVRKFHLNKISFHLYIYIPTDPIECDCHLAWLIRDNRDLLNATKSSGCSNGTRFEDLNPEGFVDCDPQELTTATPPIDSASSKPEAFLSTLLQFVLFQLSFIAFLTASQQSVSSIKSGRSALVICFHLISLEPVGCNDNISLLL